MTRGPPTSTERARGGWARWGRTLGAFVVLGGLGVLGPVLAPGPAAARAAGDVTRARFVALVRMAPDDPAALARLREVTSIDGRPVDVAAALQGASGATLTARLDTLASATPAVAGSGGASAAATREEARRVVAQAKYHAKKVPRPLRGVLRWIGDWLLPPFRSVGRALTRAFGTTGAAIVVALLLVAAAVVGAVYLAKGRSGAAARADAARIGLVDPGADPAALEQEADSAEAAGHLSTALRLRYEAGLLRLARARRLSLRPETSTGDARAEVSDPAFDRLTVTFEEVVYGGRPAVAADLDAARREWVGVLAVGASR